MDIIEKTIGEIDCENMMLPVGWRTEEGEIKRFCSITELTGEVEEAIADPKLKENAGKIITELIYGIMESMEGMTKVTKDAIRKLSVVDRDFLVVMMHKVSFGDEISWTDYCTNCKQPNDITIDMNGLKVRYLPVDYPAEFTFTLPKPVKDREGNEHSEISVVLPDGWVQERIAPIGRGNPAQASTALLQAITARLGNLEMPIHLDIFKKMPTKDRLFINKYLEEMNLGVNLVVTEVCADCGEEFTTMIPLTALLGE